MLLNFLHPIVPEEGLTWREDSRAQRRTVTQSDGSATALPQATMLIEYFQQKVLLLEMCKYLINYILAIDTIRQIT